LHASAELLEAIEVALLHGKSLGFFELTYRVLPEVITPAQLAQTRMVEN
jgi:hypothetical protein